MKYLDVLSVTVRSKAGFRSIRKADNRYCSLFTMPETDRRETGIINGWAPPPLCLPSVYLMSAHVTRYPRPSPAVFEILVMGTAWVLG